MLSISIDVYKASGKWYAGDVAKSEQDIPLFEDAFKAFVRDNLPASIGEGYVVVKDSPDGDGFHCLLYTYAELSRT